MLDGVVVLLSLLPVIRSVVERILVLTAGPICSQGSGEDKWPNYSSPMSAAEILEPKCDYGVRELCTAVCLQGGFSFFLD